MKTVKITCRQYLQIQALFNILDGDDDSRPILSNVYYDIEIDSFVITDGHIFRQEKIDWLLEDDENNKPEHSFLLKKSDIPFTKNQLKERFGKGFEVCLIDLNYDDMGEEKYPNYKITLPAIDGRFFPLEGIGFNFEYFVRFLKSFYSLSSKAFYLKFSGNELKAVSIFQRNDPLNILETPIFKGVIMPINMLNMLGESPWEITLKGSEK